MRCRDAYFGRLSEEGRLGKAGCDESGETDGRVQNQEDAPDLAIVAIWQYNFRIGPLVLNARGWLRFIN
jgi:hypothetical protein